MIMPSGVTQGFNTRSTTGKILSTTKGYYYFERTPPHSGVLTYEGRERGRRLICSGRAKTGVWCSALGAHAGEQGR